MQEFGKAGGPRFALIVRIAGLPAKSGETENPSGEFNKNSIATVSRVSGPMGLIVGEGFARNTTTVERST
jgi:hypothetical protein